MADLEDEDMVSCRLPEDTYAQLQEEAHRYSQPGAQLRPSSLARALIISGLRALKAGDPPAEIAASIGQERERPRRRRRRAAA